MRGHAPLPSVELLTRAIATEFPELDRDRLQHAVERAVARAAAASLDTEGYRVVELHLNKIEASEESTERARLMRELAEQLEERGDAERAFTTRLAAFEEAPTVGDIDPLLRTGKVTQRWAELPLEMMRGVFDINDERAVPRLLGIAEAWQHQGQGYSAADCYERVLLVDPKHTGATEALEIFYRSSGEWSVLVDLLGRRAVHVDSDKERAEIYREMGQLYERELSDDAAALAAFQDSNRLVGGNREVLEAIARIAQRIGGMDDDAFAALEAAAEQPGTDPKQHAQLLLRAAKLAQTIDWDKAHKLYERTLEADPELVAAVDGFVQLMRDKGQLSEAVTLLVNAAERPALAAERSRWLTDAGDFCVALGDTDWAKQLYLDARHADPQNAKAGVALVELVHDAGALRELVPILDDLCRTTDDPSRLRGYLIQRSKVARELGDQTGARTALARAVDLDPADLESRRELADMLFEAQQWQKAREVMEALCEHGDQLAPEASIELHYRIARCARELNDLEGAGKHAAISLALAPDHRPSLLLKEELDANDPIALTAHQLALANMAPPEERAQRFTALGDRYIELGDRATAREMYREALIHKPGDHLLLTKFLELIADEGDWSYSLDLVRRLIESEKDPKVRARYGHLAGMIARDELDNHELAVQLIGRAVEDDPMAFQAADDLEALLETGGEQEALVAFYYRRLEHVREKEGRAGERLRLWTALGELLLSLGRHDDAVVAFEVAQSLDADNPARRIRLIDLYEGDPGYDKRAIVQHQALLRGDKRRVESYKALASLYERVGKPEHAAACEEALGVIEGLDVKVVEDGVKELFNKDGAPVFAPTRARSLSDADWLALSRIDVDLQLSALFALVAPSFAAERARMRPPEAAPTRDDVIPNRIKPVLARVAASFGLTLPPVYIDRDQPSTCKLAMRIREGRLVPVMFIGRPAIDQFDEPELAFQLARQLSDLRIDRIARVLVTRPGELAQIIELGVNLHEDAKSGTSAKWLLTALHPIELDHAKALGARLRERNIVPLRAAVDWLAATERAADRIGFCVVGDLANCCRVLERDPNSQSGDVNRLVELVWSSVTEDMLAVRGRVEGWGS